MINSSIPTYGKLIAILLLMSATYTAHADRTGTVTWVNKSRFTYSVNIKAYSSCVTDPGMNNFLVGGYNNVKYNIKIQDNCDLDPKISWNFSQKRSFDYINGTVSYKETWFTRDNWLVGIQVGYQSPPTPNPIFVRATCNDSNTVCVNNPIQGTKTAIAIDVIPTVLENPGGPNRWGK